MSHSKCLKLLDDFFNADALIHDKLDELMITDHCDELQIIDGVCNEKFNNLVNKALSWDSRAKNDLKQIDDILNEKQQEIMKLEDELKESEEILNKLTIERREIENFQIIEDELARINTLKNKIKVYKLLMHVHFSYDSQALTGYIQSKSNVEVFSFDEKKIPTEEMVEKYWNKLEIASGVDCKQIADDILSS